MTLFRQTFLQIIKKYVKMIDLGGLRVGSSGCVNMTAMEGRLWTACVGMGYELPVVTCVSLNGTADS